MITPSSIALIGFIAWTLLLLVLTEAIRTQLVLRRKVPGVPRFPVAGASGVRKAHRGHGAFHGVRRANGHRCVLGFPPARTGMKPEPLRNRSTA